MNDDDDDDDCWSFNVPFRNSSAISKQLPFFFVLSMLESMAVRTKPDQLDQLH